jgi:hypothetical protein
LLIAYYYKKYMLFRVVCKSNSWLKILTCSNHELAYYVYYKMELCLKDVPISSNDVIVFKK